MNVQQSHTDCTPQESQELTLMDLLNAREDRVRHQKALLNAHPGAVLVSMTLNIPGPVKDSPRYRAALETGFHRLKAMLAASGSLSPTQEPAQASIPSPALPNHRFAILHEELRPLITGPEAYLVVRGSAANSDSDFADSASEISPGDISYIIKKAAVSVEEGSDLGRLFDIDVLISGQNTEPALYDTPDSLSDFPCGISRSQLGMKPRQCLLCGENAKACARSRAHTMDQLLAKVNEILSNAGL